MSDEQFFDLVFASLVGIRFHPRNVLSDVFVGDDVISRELALCVRVAKCAVMFRDTFNFSED